MIEGMEKCGASPPRPGIRQIPCGLFLLCIPFVAACGLFSPYTPTDPLSGPAAGNPDGNYPVPAEAMAADVSSPDHVIGTGTSESCTAEAFLDAVAQGGKIVFNGGSQPFTIYLTRPAMLFNDKPDVVIDGGGIVTLSGSGVTRILYLNTSDQQQVWTTTHAQDQEHPQLTVQNLCFIDGNAADVGEDRGGPSGGAIYDYGGRLRIVGCRFFNNRCASTGPDVGGGAVRALAQYQGLPVYVSGSTFGGAAGYGNSGSNGGALSSIMVDWALYNSLLGFNSAVGRGGNPAEWGTPGGGSGGAVYADGLTMKLSLYGCRVEDNAVNAYGAAIFFVSNNHDGTIHLEDSVLRRNSGGSWYPRADLPGISMHSDTAVELIRTTVE